MKYTLLVVALLWPLLVFSQPPEFPDVHLKYSGGMTYSQSQIEVIILTQGMCGLTNTASKEDDPKLKRKGDQHKKGLALDWRTKHLVDSRGNLLIDEHEMGFIYQCVKRNIKNLKTYFWGVYAVLEVENDAIATTFLKHWPDIPVNSNGRVRHLHVHWGKHREESLVAHADTHEKAKKIVEARRKIEPPVIRKRGPSNVSPSDWFDVTMPTTRTKAPPAKDYGSPWKNYYYNVIMKIASSHDKRWRVIVTDLDNKFGKNVSASQIHEMGFLLCQLFDMQPKAFVNYLEFINNTHSDEFQSLFESIVERLGTNRTAAPYFYIKKLKS